MMSGFKKFSGAKELVSLLSALRQDFPMSVSMWQVVRDTQDGLMEANLYTDEWPDFTTVISQEFAPRLSEVADIRIHTRNKERVMQVINGAKLLEKTGSVQHILYFTEEKDELSQHLLDAISPHPAANGRVVSSYNLPLHYLTKFPEKITRRPLPSGYVIEDLLPEHAEFIARHWNLKDWFTEVTPLELKRKFIEELIRRFISIGVFRTEDPSQPVAWTFRKPGGIHGISFVTKPHRERSIHSSNKDEAIFQARERKEVLLVETRTPVSKNYGYQCIGTSHAIVIHKPTISSKM